MCPKFFKDVVHFKYEGKNTFKIFVQEWDESVNRIRFAQERDKWTDVVNAA